MMKWIKKFLKEWAEEQEKLCPCCGYYCTCKSVYCLPPPLGDKK